MCVMLREVNSCPTCLLTRFTANFQFSLLFCKVQWGLTCSVVFAARAAAQCEVLAPSSIDTYFELNAQGSTLVAPYWLVICPYPLRDANMATQARVLLHKNTANEFIEAK